MTDSNFDNGFEKLPAAGEFLAGASAGGLHPEELRGPAMSSEAASKESSQTSKASCCSWIKSVDPRVVDLIYWRDAKKTGVVFGSTLVLLLSLALFSVLSVFAYLSLVTLTVTISYRVYRSILASLQKTGEGHPFQRYLEMDISLPSDSVHKFADELSAHLLCTVSEVRRLFLVEDMVDTLKFGLLLWVLTYIGTWFNGMTLIILADVLLFSVPKFYDVNKAEVDHFVGMARKQIETLWKQVQDKVPVLGKKKKA